MTFSTGKSAVDALVTSSTAGRMICCTKLMPTFLISSLHLAPSMEKFTTIVVWTFCRSRLEASALTSNFCTFTSTWYTEVVKGL